MEQPNSNLLSALEKARENGFVDDLFINDVGQVMSASQEIPNPQIIEIVPCLSCGATLYLISGDGRHGTWVHHWEAPNS